ncbi:MAG TPA: hypothetical protein VMX11_02815 [Actinomycetes bacterium]|jgi:hypothetical protein|nr:hypothetical protein [Actinomycetes bacterium]
MSSHEEPPSDESSLADDEALEIATDAYIYASAIVQMEVHRRVLTNQEASDGKQMRGRSRPSRRTGSNCEEVTGPFSGIALEWRGSRICPYYL